MAAAYADACLANLAPEGAGEDAGLSEWPVDPAEWVKVGRQVTGFFVANGQLLYRLDPVTAGFDFYDARCGRLGGFWRHETLTRVEAHALDSAATAYGPVLPRLSAELVVVGLADALWLAGLPWDDGTLAGWGT
jgi:hypothetical protein